LSRALLHSIAFVLACTGSSIAHAQLGSFSLLRTPADTANRSIAFAIPSGYAYQQLGVFCKLDVQLERRFKMPIFFRLGDMMHVEEWEGKGPLVIPFEDR